MTEAISPEQRATLDRLFSDLAGSINGALDFWTLVCLFPADFEFDRHGFVAEKSARLRVLVEQVRSALEEANLLAEQPISTLLEALVTACTKLLSAFLVLEKFRTVPLAEVRSAAQLLAEAYSDLYRSIEDLGTTLGVPMSYRQTQTSERQEYFRRILDSLEKLFCEAHPAEQHGIAAPSRS